MILLRIAAAALLAAPAFAADGGTVEITVDHIRSAKGTVMVQLCSEKQFLGKCPIGASVPARPGSVTIILRNVPPGDYAAMAFQDANGNGTLDRWLGLPREDLGLSRLDRLPMRPPRFRDSMFTHGAGDQKLSIKLGNYFG